MCACCCCCRPCSVWWFRRCLCCGCGGCCALGTGVVHVTCNRSSFSQKQRAARVCVLLILTRMRFGASLRSLDSAQMRVAAVTGNLEVKLTLMRALDERVFREEAEARAKLRLAQEESKACKESLEAVIPMLERAMRGLSELKSSDISEIRTMNTPPAGASWAAMCRALLCHVALRCVELRCVVLGRCCCAECCCVPCAVVVSCGGEVRCFGVLHSLV